MYFFFFLFGHKVYGILHPWLGIEYTLPALKGQVLTTALPGIFLSFLLILCLLSSLLYPIA